VAEVLEAEIDLATHEAFRNLQAFAAQLEAAEKQVNTLSQRVQTLEANTEKLATTKRKATGSAKEFDDIGTSNIGTLGKWSGAVVSLIGSYVGFTAVIETLRRVEQAQKDVNEATSKGVNARLDLSRTLRDLQFNLNIPTTAAGQNEARAILQDFMSRAPGADVPTIASVLGQANAFRFDVRQPGAGRDIASDVIRMTARLGLNPETGGDIVRLLGTANARDPQSARRLLAQLEAAARTSPIESPREFMDAALRTTLPLMAQGLGVEEAFGMFAAAAGSDPSPLRAATNVLQYSRLWIGRDEKSMAELFRRSTESGLLDRKKFADLEKQIAESVMPEYGPRIRNAQQTIADAERDTETERSDFDRDMADLQAQQRRAGTDTEKLAAASNAIESRREGFDRSQRERQQQAQRARDSLAQIQKSATEKINLRLGSAAWRSLSFGQRESIFRQMTAGLNAPGFESLVSSLGATQEETQAGTGIVLGQGPAAVAATVSAMRGADVGQFVRENQQFEQLDIARQTATQNEVAMRQSASVSDLDVMVKQFQELSAARADAMSIAAGGRPFLMSETQYRLRVFLQELTDQFNAWYATVSDEERKQFPEIDSLASSMSSLLSEGSITSEFSNSYLETEIKSFARRFVIIAQKVSDFRSTYTGSRTMSRPRTRVQNIIFGVQMNDAGGRPLAPASPPMRFVPTPGVPSDLAPPGSTVQEIPGTGGGSPAPVPGSAGASAVYNVTIGTVVSGGADVVDTIGRLEQAEQA
jgi:hypothetical protein